MDFVFEQIRTGGDRNLAYLLGDRSAREAALIDPSFSPREVVDRATAQGLSAKLILNTHGHGDHTNGNAEAKRLTGAPVAAHPASPARPDHPLADREELRVGSITAVVLHAPGHSPDSVVLHVPAMRIAITGDLLFVGKIGGTGDEESATIEYATLRRLVALLPDDTTIWPGHDYECRPASTMLLEKAANPFLRARDLAEFLELKREWATFKARHGLL